MCHAQHLPGGPCVGAPGLGPEIGLHFGVRIISQEVLKHAAESQRSKECQQTQETFGQGPLIFLENDQVPGVREFVWR